MSICIIGAGLAGLSTAIKIKLDKPEMHIVVLDKLAKQSNTQMAGMRLQIGDGKRTLPRAYELSRRIALRNNGEITEEMKEFAQMTLEEVEFWQTFHKKNYTHTEPLHFETDPQWFGPQWGKSNNAGKGRGVNLLTWFEDNAKKLGIEFKKAEVEKVVVNNGYIEGLIARNQEKKLYSDYVMIQADAYIFAGGNAGGAMFESTNRTILNSPQELAFDAGFPIIDTSNFMFHPFGRCTSQGMPILCCYETDAISDVTVHFTDDTIDYETTDLLRAHQAHYHFNEIAKRFYEHGSFVHLKRAGNSEIEFARLSHHYSHIAIKTESNGVQVYGAENLYAVGDAAGVGRNINHKVRIPGTALTNCLVDAEILRKTLSAESYTRTNRTIFKSINNYRPKEILSEQDRNKLKKINTDRLFAIKFGSNIDTSVVIQEWKNELYTLPQTPLVRLSIGTAHTMELINMSNAIEPLTMRIERENKTNYIDKDYLHLTTSLV